MQQLIRLNQLDLIRFFPLDVPHVDGLPPGAEIASNVPFSNHTHLATAFDQTKHQVETILISLKPDFILFDFAFWVPALARCLGIKSIYYSVEWPVTYTLWLDPSRNSFGKNRTVDELVQLPLG
ncbi:hypothetical protein L1049_012544 [Liquidambar formosana]|uniref:UDP-glycosyltransferase n=1 Tax=Liquidambar formosana TaxID=63359 RepID=A0AAP0N614_LIQFO